ncbi:hypothetical protein MMC29_008066 [Sticta canariensis]|nr:hypothetical protein [Sticta canariensis]
MAAEGSQHYSGALAQQGSLDWVALSKTTVSFSVELLARYARAGVEALTIAVGQALFARFCVPADGQERLELSVKRLKAYSSAAKALWFGIGFKHLIRTLMETEQGATFVAVSSCLMVSYDNQFSATVLKTLCDRSSVPEKLTPSLSQWIAFVKLCTPAVTGFQFPLLVEGFSRLLMSSATKRTPENLVATSPIELATALLELAELSTGKVAMITLTGNADCGWLAALAEWLFSLRVEILDHTGNSLYQSKAGNHSSVSNFQLTVIRLEEGQRFQNSLPQSLLHSRTHLIPPGDPGFNRRTATSYHLFYQGRSDWSTILNDTFGRSFQRLLEPEIIPLFVKVLYSGLSARVHDDAIGRMNPWGGTLFIGNSVQHQRRFIQMLHFATTRLPELADLKKYDRLPASELDNLDLERQKTPSDLEAGSSDPFLHYSCLEKDTLSRSGFSTALIDACSCGGCKVVDKNSSSQGAVSILDYLCLSKVAIAVFEFIWCLSWLDIDDMIRPSSNGLMRFYSKFETPNQVRSKILDSGEFRRAVMLLTGFDPGSTAQQCSAVTVHGLCVYFSSLEHPNIGVEGQFRLRVVPGQIERHEKYYDYISETPNPWFSSRVGNKRKVDVNETTKVIAILGARPHLQLAIEETIDDKFLSTKLLVTPEKNVQIHWNFLYRPFLDREAQIQYQQSCFLSGPAQLSRWMRAALNVIQCEKTHSSTFTSPVWTIEGAVEPWSGRCSVIDLPWWTDDPGMDKRLPSIPEPNEWIVAVRDGFNGLRVFCGSPTLLYCILDRLGTDDEDTFLLQAGDCLVCMVLEKVFGAERQLQNLSILFPIGGGDVQKLDFQLRSDRMSINMGMSTYTP